MSVRFPFFPFFGGHRSRAGSEKTGHTEPAPRRSPSHARKQRCNEGDQFARQRREASARIECLESPAPSRGPFGGWGGGIFLLPEAAHLLQEFSLPRQNRLQRTLVFQLARNAAPDRP